MARPSLLDDPEQVALIAQAFVDGASRQDMMDMFGVNKNTVTAWRRDPRVKAKSMQLTEDRILRITRKIDSTIERRLQDAEKLDVETLIKMRKEFLGGFMRQQAQGETGDVANEIMAGMDDPQIAEGLSQLQEFLNRASKKE